MSSQNTEWLPPSGPASDDDAAAPRFGAYGYAPAGAPNDTAGYQYASGHAASPGAFPGPADPKGSAGPQGQYAQQAQSFGVPAPGGFILAPKPGIIPLRPLDIMEIISGAFDSLRANPRAMFVPALLVMSVVGALTGVLTYVGSRASFNTLDQIYADPTAASADVTVNPLATVLPSVLNAVLVATVTIVLTGLLIVAVSRSVLGRVATPGEVWARTRTRIWALFGQSILVSLISGAALTLVAVAFVVLIVGLGGSILSDSPTGLVLSLLLGFLLLIGAFILGVFFWVRLSLASAALILENIGVIEGIKRSWTLTRNGFWRILGVLLLTSIIAGTVNAILSTVLTTLGALALMAGPEAQAVALGVTSFASSVISAVILPFTAAVTALLYVDQRMRIEGLDVELRRAAGV